MVVIRGQKSEVRNHNATTASVVTPMSGETVNASIGTLKDGNSVTITFQVTVNNPPNLSQITPPQVSNHGTVTGSFGSVDTNTVNTPVDRFDSATTLVTDHPVSAAPGDTVTFTLWPSQRLPNVGYFVQAVLADGSVYRDCGFVKYREAVANSSQFRCDEGSRAGPQQ